MTELTYLAAIGRAQGEAMEEDPRVVILGEDLRSNLYGTAPDFVARFGADRVWDTPLSEAGFSGLAAGAAMTASAYLANHAAGIVVGKVGTATATAAELLASFGSEGDAK